MARKKDPYASYDLDDWRWEFLRRNRRYQRAYYAIEWLKERFHRRQTENPLFKSFINLFGFKFYITSHGEYRNPGDDCSKPYKGQDTLIEVWSYQSCTALIRGVPKQRRSPVLDLWGDKLGLVDPDASSLQYKAKLLRKEAPVYEIQSHWSDSPWDVWKPRFEGEISLLVDTRYSTPEILSSVKQILAAKNDQTRNRMKLYPAQLQVWNLFEEGFTAEEIAAKLYPKEYAERGGNRSGDKSALSSQIYQYRDRCIELIEASFPRKKRPPKIQK